MILIDLHRLHLAHTRKNINKSHRGRGEGQLEINRDVGKKKRKRSRREKEREKDRIEEKNGNKMKEIEAFSQYILSNLSTDNYNAREKWKYTSKAEKMR